MHPIRRETAAANNETDPFDFILSDATKDRYGDIIEPEGWKLAHFKRNPIALFNHDSDHPIGVWENIRVEAGALRARLKLAAQGTSARIDEIRRLVEQKVLRAASVGFLPIKGEPLDEAKPYAGWRFLIQELLETSVVSVPANPNALTVAKALKISDETLALVFGKQAIEHRGLATGQAGPRQQRHQGNGTMNIAQRIAATEQRLVGLRDQLQRHLDNMGDDPDDAALQTQTDLNGSIESAQRNLDNLRASERALAGTATPAGQGGQADDDDDEIALPAQGGQRQLPTRQGERQGNQPWYTQPQGQQGQQPNQNLMRAFAVPATKVQPADHVFRALAVLVKNHGENGTTRVDTLSREYGESNLSVATKVVMDVLTRAASAPADTLTPAWAGNLVQTAVGEFFNLLLPQSLYPGLRDRGGRFTFGRNGTISLPTRAATPTVSGAFVAQGAPIPVRQAAFSAVTLTPKKMGVITTMTREIMEASTPALEGILRQAIQEDTSVTLDSVLIDNVVASAVRPAGLRAGVTVTTATSGGGFAALVGDIKNLISALITSTNGNLRAPVWLVNPIRAITIGLTQNAGGDFPFKADIDANRLQGIPVLQSTTVPADMMILVDAADFFSATGDEPRFDVSDQAVLHMEDTTPLAIGTMVSTTPTVATPVRSLWQTDTLGLRMIMDINWALRRTGVVAWTTAVTW